MADEQVKDAVPEKDDEKKKSKGDKRNPGTNGKSQVIINPIVNDDPDNAVEIESGGNTSQGVNEALTVLQRMKRGQVARRIQPKLKMARERAQSRIASDDKIKQRALRKARDIIRSRVAGNSGTSYEDMDAGSKIRIDKMIENKQDLIKRLAQRIFPVAKRAEQARHSNFTHKDMVDHRPKAVTEALATKTGDYAAHLASEMDKHHGQTYDHPRWGKTACNTRDISRGSGHGLASGQGNRESGHFIKRDNYHKVPESKLSAAEDAVIRSKPKIKVKTGSGPKDAYNHGKHLVVDHGHGRFSVHSKSKYKQITEAYDKTDGAADAKDTTRYKQEVILDKSGNRRVVNRAVKIKSLQEKVAEALAKKAEANNIPVGVLEAVMESGLERYDAEKHGHLTPEQYAFAGVNKHIAESTTKGRFRANLNEHIKGWKHAASDLNAHRHEASTTHYTHSLTKDGKLSGMKDARKGHASLAAAEEHANRVKGLNTRMQNRDAFAILDAKTGKEMKRV